MNNQTPEFHASKKLRLAAVAFLAILITGALLFWWGITPVGRKLSKQINSQGSSQPIRQLDVELSPAERFYLHELGAVKMCIDPDWEPYERINEKGEHEGIAADLINIIAQRCGVSLELVQTKNWEESIDASQTGKCQILSFLNQTTERDEWLLFTEPYFSDPNVLITREEHAFISDPASLSNETIVLPVQTSAAEYFKSNYPNLTILIIGSSEVETFTMVSERKADMTLRSQTMAAYTIKKEGLFNLKIAGQIPNFSSNFRIGVVKDRPMLRDILDKGVRSITQQEVEQIVNQYISIKIQKAVDYALLVKIVLAFALLVAIGFLWNYQLRKVNLKLAARESELIALSSKLEEDIVVRKQTEEKLRESEHRYRILIETANEGILVAQDTRFKFVNPMMLQLTGRSEQELLSLPFLEFIHHDDRELVRNNFLRRVNGEAVDSRYHCRLLKNDNSTRWIEMSGVLIEWEGQPATINFVTDIMDRKKAEQEIKLKNEELIKINAEKDKFFSIIAHDLRSPFNGFLGLTQLMVEKSPEMTLDTIQDIAVNMRNSAANLFRLLENLLQWSQMEQGLIPFNPKIVQLLPIVDDSIAMVLELAKNKGIEIAYDIPDDLVVFVDHNILQTVIRNFVSNAVKFTPKGGKISLSAKASSDKYVEISIKDSGIGMSRTMVDNLFRLGVQTNRKGTEGETSTGLGLLLCKEFIEKLSGKIWLESVEGKGSIFYFTILMGFPPR